MSRNYYPRLYMTEYIKVKLDPNHFHKKRFVYKSKLSPQANHSIFPVVFPCYYKGIIFSDFSFLSVLFRIIILICNGNIIHYSTSFRHCSVQNTLHSTYGKHDVVEICVIKNRSSQILISKLPHTSERCYLK